MSEAVETRLLELLEKVNEKLGDVVTGLALQTQMLENHTASDTSNFAALSAAITELKTKLDIIELARAREDGAREAEARSNKFSAVKWGGGIAAFLTGIFEGIRHLMAN